MLQKSVTYNLSFINLLILSCQNKSQNPSKRNARSESINWPMTKQHVTRSTTWFKICKLQPIVIRVTRVLAQVILHNPFRCISRLLLVIKNATNLIARVKNFQVIKAYSERSFNIQINKYIFDLYKNFHRGNVKK